MKFIRDIYELEIIGDYREATVYIAASKDFCCTLSEYGKENLDFNLNTQNPIEAVHVVRDLLKYGYEY